MKGTTHSLVGAAGFLVLAHYVPDTTWMLPSNIASLDSLLTLGTGAVVAGMVALLPDIDEPESTISRFGSFRAGPLRLRPLWGLSYLLKRTVGHRTLTHSLLAISLAAVIGLSLTLLGHVALGVAVIWGYASHVLADMCTRSGVPLLWPIVPRSFHLLPPGLRLRTGSLAESAVAVAVLVGTGWWLAAGV
jgi:inner membrane protein